MRYCHAIRLLALVPATAIAVPAFCEDEGEPAARTVLVMQFDDAAISPATTRFFDRALDQAEEQRAECLVVMLDTPGGVLDSTRWMVKRILASRTPVVVYVAPSGSRAASAGVFITLSAHVAAMAPGTTIGAAHPVRIGGLPIGPSPDSQVDRPIDGQPPSPDGADRPTGGRQKIEEKIVHDTVAWARALAERRGRNARWAAEAVSESVSITAREAVEQEVVDLVATGLDDLLDQLDGREVALPQGTRTLKTSDARIERVSMWWAEQLLMIIAAPNIAFLLMIFGFYGILFELYSPGWGVPGTLGIVCMLLGLFGLAVLPVNYLGLGLILVGLCLLAAEVFVTSYGALAIAGTVCLALGGIMLVDSPTGFSRVSLSVVLPVAAGTAVIVLFLVGGIVRAHSSRVQTGGEALVGREAKAIDAFIPSPEGFQGTVLVHGERWNARCPHPLKAGRSCLVAGRTGLTLLVEPIEGEPTNHSAAESADSAAEEGLR